MQTFIKKALIATLIPSAIFYQLTVSAAPLSAADKTQIQEVVRKYLNEKPEVIVEALQGMQRKQYQEAEKTVKKTQQVAAQFAEALFRQANDPIAGNPKGTITVTEFFDYQCPHCVEMTPVITEIVKANPNVRIVYKEFPIRGPMSELASRVALAANKQGKYVEFQHALMESGQPLTEANIYKIAAQVGLNVDQIKKDVKDSSIEKQLKANYKLAQDLKLFGTPAFFIGKTDVTSKGPISYIPGQMNQQQLQNEIDKVN